MGNCVFKGFNHEVEDQKVKVMTSNGGIMELTTPITVECITNEFPNHAIFKSGSNIFSDPLLHSEELHAGEIYHLLPINPYKPCSNKTTVQDSDAYLSTPYRMSCDDRSNGSRSTVNKKREGVEVLPRYNSTGVWKVKLVISPEQLNEILSQETQTEELIESVRTVAKCGNGVSSKVNSDQWSVSSSWKGYSSDKYG